jgi:hypothetical protein
MNTKPFVSWGVYGGSTSLQTNGYFASWGLWTNPNTTALKLKVFIGGVLKTVVAIKVFIGGALKTVTAVKAFIGGSLKNV